MILHIKNINDFWEAIDSSADSPYSLVIEGENNQCVLYVYDTQWQKVLAALLLPSSLSVPFAIDVNWKNEVCFVNIGNYLSASFDAKHLIGETNSGNWIIHNS